MDSLINMQALGEQLLLLRRRAGLSQAALAQRAGIDTMTVSRIESGQKKRLELETAARLARVFGTSLDQFCGLEATVTAEISPSSVLSSPEPDRALVLQQWPKNEQELAAQILSWNKQEGMSLRAIVQRLNAAGVPTRSGRGQWYQASVSELLRQRIPRRQKDRKDFMAKYGPGHHTVAEETVPQPTQQQIPEKPEKHL